MLHVYIDYPTSHMTIHGDSGCQFIRPFSRPQQRISKITIGTLSRELKRFADKDYRFASVAIMNDIWLEIDLDDRAFEGAVAEYILKLIARHYKPLRGIKPSVHC